MDRDQLDQWCERGVLGLILAVLVFSPLAFGSVRGQEFVVVQWLTVGVLLVWYIRFWVNPKHRLLWPPVCWAVLAFMGYAVGRYATADIEYVARQEMIQVLVYGFLCFAILNNLHRQETTQVLALTVVFLGAVVALYAIYQFLSNSEHIWHLAKPDAYRKRASGPFICPNHLAGYLEMLLPLALTCTLTGRFSYLMKVLLAYASLALFAGMVVTVSRGGWVACAASLVVLFVWLVRQRDYRLQALLGMGALVAVGAVLLFKLQFSPKRYEVFRLASATEDVRFLLWQPAIQMWRDHLWWGVGPGHFDHRFGQYRPETFDLQFQPERTHNDYLNTLVDWGLVGTALVAIVWLLFYWDVFRSWKYVQRAHNDLAAKRSNKTSVVVGGAAGLFAMLLHSFVDFNMHIPANAILAVTLLALVSGHFRFATERYWHTVRWPLRIPVNLVLGAALIYLALVSWKRAPDAFWQVRAKEYAARKKQAVEKAAALATNGPVTAEREWRRQAVELAAQEAAAWARAYAADPANAEAANQMGEALWMQSLQGGEDYQQLAARAMEWFRRSMDLNPYAPLVWVRYGQCLDWLGRHAEAVKYFDRALVLDPYGYNTLAHVGWHYMQVEDYRKAEHYLNLSHRLFPMNNPVASSYLKILRERRAEKPSSR
jgi:O-antigen ligase/Tfp pilus assembly protein PilF